MNLLEKAKTLPTTPGVYLMKDSSQQIIYVGKSKNLKNRVSSYFQNSSSHSKKVEKMVKHLKNFDYILTDTEFEAFMLECKLIKKIQPMYNRMMKTPKAYTYLVFRWRKGMYQIEVTNQIEQEDIHYFFGPFTSKRSVENAVIGLKEFYKMDCSQSMHGNGPCFNYSLNQCIGICFKPSAFEIYQEIMHRIIALFKGTDDSVMAELKHSMEAASNRFEFEKAVKIRTIIELLDSLLKKETVVDFTKANHAIVAGEWLEETKLKMFFIKGFEILGSYVYEKETLDTKQVIQAILTYFSGRNHISSDLEKESLDEAQIIYRYINSGNNRYIIIPQENVLESKNESLEESVQCFINDLIQDHSIV